MLRLLIFLLLVSQELLANDAPFKSFFENERQVLSENKQVVDFRLALSELKKINNTWVLDREEMLSGDLYRRTIELDSNYFLNEVVGNVEEYFSQRQAQELYRCNGLDCGSSSAWANNYFKVKLLYGLDPSQAYRVWALKVNNLPAYISSYIVKRGNKRIYVHLDVLVSKKARNAQGIIPPDPKSIVHALKKFHYYRVPQQAGGSFTTNGDLLKPVAEALRANPTIKVAIVGHDFLGASVEERKSNSLAYAAKVAELLTALGVSSKRFTTQGLGGLVPQLNADEPSTVYLVLESGQA